MSRITRTRSSAAGIEAPPASVGLQNEPLGNAAAAAKNRHSDLRQHQQEAKPQPQPPVMPADNAGQHSTDMPQAGLEHQGSLDENVLVSQSGTLKASDGKIPQAQANTHISSNSRAARTRSLPPKPSTGRTRSAKPPLARTTQAAPAPAEHALPEAPAALSATNSLSLTLVGIAQSLVAFSANLHTTPAGPEDDLPEQIDMNCDLTNDSEDSDFQPEAEPAQDDDVIDLSQEDPLDVVEHADGSIAIRSPLQAAAVAAVEAAAEAGGDDDEEEFQQLQGKGKRKQAAAAKDMLGGRSQHSTTLACSLADPA